LLSDGVKLAEGLRPLLALPVEVVLPAHGAPTDRVAQPWDQDFRKAKRRDRMVGNDRRVTA
jgi:hypothetical protein